MKFIDVFIRAQYLLKMAEVECDGKDLVGISLHVSIPPQHCEPLIRLIVMRSLLSSNRVTAGDFSGFIANHKWLVEYLCSIREICEASLEEC